MALTFPLNLLKFIGQDRYDKDDYDYAVKNFTENLAVVINGLREEDLKAAGIFIEVFDKNKTFRDCANDMKVGIAYIKKQFIKATNIFKKEENILTLFAGKEVSIQHRMLRDEYIKLNKEYKTKIKTLIGKTGVFNLNKDDKLYLDEWSLADIGLTPKQYIFLKDNSIKSIRELLEFNFSDLIDRKTTTPDFINAILQKTEDFFKTNNE